MKPPTLLPTRPPRATVPDMPETTLTVRPVRAAFGPHVSLVSVDDQGRLWMRFSTALGMMLAGLALLTVPMFALWWVGGGLVDSGQVTLQDPRDWTRIGPPGSPEPRPTSPTELPLATHGD